MTSLSQSFHLSSSLKEEAMVTTNNQGIVSILDHSNTETIKNSCASSLRRTLSADMSSKKWQTQHGLFSSFKKIASSEQIWSPINEEQEEKKRSDDDVVTKQGQFDMWSSILTQKSQEDNKNLPPPYIHPLVKRSASSLSQKSLQICTESLGSETGSDGFSSYPPSEYSDVDSEEKEEEEEKTLKIQVTEVEAALFEVTERKATNGAKQKYEKSIPRSFPPPIPSLSSRNGAASVTMRSHRDNGRLVLKAVSVPSQNKFHAQRKDGRLVLTFIDGTNDDAEENEMEQFKMELESSGEDQEHEMETEEESEIEEDENENENLKNYDNLVNKFVNEEAPKLSSGMVVFNKLASIANKRVVLANRNITAWTNKFAEMVEFEEEEVVVEPVTPLTQSLPLPPAMVPRMITSSPNTASAVAAAAGAASFNAYEYYWKPTAIRGTTPMLNSIIQKTKDNNKLKLSKNLVAVNDQQQQRGLVILRCQKGDYHLIPLLKSCKELKRSLPFEEPHYIATS